MGLFDKLFNNKKENEEKKVEETSLEETPYEQKFDFYFTRVDDIIGSMFVDLGLFENAPIKDSSNLVWISLKLNSPREDGMSSAEESEVLYGLEDKLETKLKETHNAIWAGRLTSNGKRDYYFYFGDITLYDKAISEVMVEFPTYEFDYGNKMDAEWETYFNFLYPTEREMQCLSNRQVIDNLEKHGDNLVKPRQVEHWIYFNSEVDRTNYITKISASNFKVESAEIDNDSEDEKYPLHISRTDSVELDEVNDYVLFLWELANENNGRYDGWETSIEKD